MAEIDKPVGDQGIEYPHSMYDCETGERYTANNYAEHREFTSLGYVHSLNECEDRGIIYVPPPNSDDADDSFTPPPVEEVEYDEVEVDEVEVVEDQDQVYVPPVVPIDPSDDYTGLIIEDYSPEEFIWKQVPTPNFNASPSPFQTISSSGNVNIDEDSLYAESDEDNSSSFFIRIKDGTRVTMSVKLAYSNKTVNRNTVRPHDWSEEFDLIVEGGDTIRWSVPDQPKGSTNPLKLGRIDNPRDGELSIVVADQERIDQNAGVFITYFEKITGNWHAYAKGEIGIELKIEKYEVAVGPVPEPDPDDPSGGVGFVPEPIQEEEIFDETTVLLGLAVMAILAIYIYSISYNPTAEGA